MGRVWVLIGPLHAPPRPTTGRFDTCSRLDLQNNQCKPVWTGRGQQPLKHFILTNLTLTSPHRAAVTCRPSPCSTVLTSPSLVTVLHRHRAVTHLHLYVVTARVGPPSSVVPSPFPSQRPSTRHGVTIPAPCFSWYWVVT
ncbi:hypothetical protein PIB30_010657 [Stylosanthes scabra]|uniref:Uncharacterized protein n=1 Tax=Stylosanthes scabra TaxID=79078 RepID=A0ABU6V6B3_9FABA|nr:hypothetical protein [Stylosanthes scabra]